jgi:hypothetical protein
LQFDLISFPGIGTLTSAAVFDLQNAKQMFQGSEEVMEQCDDQKLSASTIVYDAQESLVKFRFYVNEQPQSELIATATSMNVKGTFCAPSGVLCAGWQTGFIKPDMWISALGYDTRDGFRGQYQEISPGYYEVELYGLLGPPLEPDVKPQRWYDTVLAWGCLGGIVIVFILMWLPFALCVAALLFWEWKYLLGLIPYVVVQVFLMWNARKIPAIWKEQAEEYRRKPPDIIIVMRSLSQPINDNVIGKACLTRPGIEDRNTRLMRFRSAFPSSGA